MPPFALTPLDISIIAGSLIAVVLVGLWASRQQDKSASGYFLASGRLPWWIIGSAFVSTSVSSEQIVGTVGQAYAHGMGVANWELWSLPVYSLLIVFFIPIYLRNNVTTVPDFLTRRYGPLCADIYSWVMLVAYVLIFMVPVLYGGSLTLHQLTGWNFHAVLWGMVLLVGLYTVKGGLASVVWTDAAQCLMLVGGGILLYFLALRDIPGGWNAMMQASPDRFHLYHPPDDPVAPFLGLVLGNFGVFLFYQATNQVMIQRVLGARSTWDGIMGIIFAGMINFLRPLVTCFLGFIVYHWIHVMDAAPPLANSDHTFPFALRQWGSSWGLRGIILAGFLAAVMSTISALANSTATLFALDVYRKWIRRDAPDRRLVQVGRYASLLALVVAAVLAPSVERVGGIFVYFQTGVTFLAVPFASVVLLGILWRRANYPGAVFGTAGGVVIAAAAMAVHLYLQGLARRDLIGYAPHWLYSAAAAQGVIVLGIILVSLLTPPPAAGQWQPFLWRPAMLADLGAPRRPWYASLKLWFSVYAAGWVAMYAWLW